MKKFWILWCREIALYFRSPAAYVILFFFVLLTGVNFYLMVNAMNRGPGSTTLVEAFFNNVFFWFGFILPFPLITMRLFAEEFKLGTIEPLMTAPVRDFQVVAAKYLSALFFYVVLWAPSALYFAIFQWLTRVDAANAAGSWLGAYSMLLLIGMFYIAIGCLTSVLTKNQVVAAIMAFAVISVMFYIGLFNVLFANLSPHVRDLTTYVSAITHMAEYSQGLIDSRPIVFYLSMTGLTLYITFQIFQSRKWRQ